MNASGIKDRYQIYYRFILKIFDPFRLIGNFYYFKNFDFLENSCKIKIFYVFFYIEKIFIIETDLYTIFFTKFNKFSNKNLIENTL